MALTKYKEVPMKDFFESDIATILAVGIAFALIAWSFGGCINLVTIGLK